MKIEVVVPEVGESISSGILSVWLKKDGQYVEEGEELYELETDKTTLAVPASSSGIIQVQVPENEEVEVGQVIGFIEPSAEKPDSKKSVRDDSEININTAQPQPTEEAAASGTKSETALEDLSPAVRRIVVENNLDPSMIRGTGKEGRIIKEDAVNAVSRPEKTSVAGSGVLKSGAQPDKQAAQRQNRVKMTGLRKKIAENLVHSKQSSAHLTTFNEIDMSSVIEIRNIFGEDFEKKHGIRLGFMSFFIKACQETLAVYPLINAFIDGDDIVYNNFYDIGVALSTDKGLIAPVKRDPFL
jgi:2-oxoglutarate dehydrogenase E2 component (dihydrolipoamide succinyltransferase)